MKRDFSQIEHIIKQACGEFSLRLYLLEWGDKGVKVYVDKPRSVVSISDIEKVSRRMNFFFLAEGFSDQIEVEVSSPGLERKLKYPWHFSEVLKKKIHFETCTSFYDKKSFTGNVFEVNEEFLWIENEEGVLKFPFHSIKKAYLVFEMKKNKKVSFKKVYKQ